MYITLETDYAVRIMVILIGENCRMDAKTIAERADVTLRFALKILGKLACAGFVRSFKGIKGGYEYARESPKDLTLYEVVEAVEGPCFVSRCLGTVGCLHGRESFCKAHEVFAQIADTLRAEMEAVTFDRLI